MFIHVSIIKRSD